MLNEPNWLPLEVVLAINSDAVALTSETYFLREPGLLESAICKPQNHWHYGERDIITLSVMLFAGISQNHCFEEGNKRTAWTAALTFLEANGYTIPDRLDSATLGELLTRVVAKKTSVEVLIRLLRKYARPL